MNVNPKLFERIQIDEGDGWSRSFDTEITLHDLYAAFAYAALRIANPKAQTSFLAQSAFSEAAALLAERSKP